MARAMVDGERGSMDLVVVDGKKGAFIEGVFVENVCAGEWYDESCQSMIILGPLLNQVIYHLRDEQRANHWPEDHPLIGTCRQLESMQDAQVKTQMELSFWCAEQNGLFDVVRRAEKKRSRTLLKNTAVIGGGEF